MMGETETTPFAFEEPRRSAVASDPRTSAGPRPHVTFSQAERELRRVHALESARHLARLARLGSRSLPFGGVASLWRDPPPARALAAVVDELRLARRDAAQREPLLELCSTSPRRAWPSAGELAAAACERRAGADERLTRALARFAATGAAGPEPVQVLLVCSRGRSRALAFALLGFGALASGDAAGARAHFDAAHRERPSDARLAWLAQAARRDASADARGAEGFPRLVIAFDRARERGGRAPFRSGRAEAQVGAQAPSGDEPEART
ncbi:MAG: hypothetical protein IPJ77_13555 [Planctomycetes bacterium]|nr:hypothetical protein [Planctomycetota bacterium]